MRLAPALALLVPALLVLVGGAADAASPAGPPAAGTAVPVDLTGLPVTGDLCVPTHIGFFGDVTTLTSTVTRGGAVFYRVQGGPWQVSDLPLKGGHSVARLPDGTWLINDTDHHRMVQVDDLSGHGSIVARTELAGIRLSRPHDQIVDPETGYAYVIDGGRHLFRFRTLDGPVEVWSFTPEEMNYARSLSWFDGHLHLIHSSRGEVWRIDDFDRHLYTVFRSPRPRDGAARSATPYRDFPAGALATTGLVLNDVEKVDGWYYGTNYFTPSYAFGGDTAPARLIRWRNWEDFAQGRWQDLSGLLPAADPPLVPYYLTLHDGTLHIAVFDHDGHCSLDGIVALSPPQVLPGQVPR